jgi:hypothetical protein
MNCVCAQDSVQLMVGTHRIVLSFFLVSAGSRFDDESKLPPTKSNAHRWAQIKRKEFYET